MAYVNSKTHAASNPLTYLILHKLTPDRYTTGKRILYSFNLKSMFIVLRQQPHEDRCLYYRYHINGL